MRTFACRERINLATNHVNGKRSETMAHIALVQVYRVLLSNFVIAFVARNCGSNFLIALHRGAVAVH